MIATTILEILGSLGMFLFGMKVMSEALQKLSGERLRGMMRTMTGNRFAGLFTGLAVTCLVQSSSATTVMIVSFVNAGLLNLTESIGMIMGANLGTTTTFWIVSLLGFKVKISAIALPIIGIGLPFIFIGRPKTRDLGEMLIGFGILFLGLEFLKDSVPDISSNPDALGFVQGLTGQGLLSVIYFFIFGTILTVVLQSSSAAGAITITMAAKGWIDFDTAAAIILGENVGTTITANIAALGANIHAKRAAFAHFIFNIIGVIWAILLFFPFVGLVDKIVPGDALEPANIPMHMAVFHSGFNLINIVLLIGFVPYLALLVQKILSGKRVDGKTLGQEHITFESSTIPRTGEMNLAEAEREVVEMSQLTRKLVEGFVDLLGEEPEDLGAVVEDMKELEKQSDIKAFETTAYLLRCSSSQVSVATMTRVTSLLRVVAELEDTCDCAYRLALIGERRHRKSRKLSDETDEQIRQFSQIVLQFLEFCESCLTRPVGAADMETAYQIESSINSLRKSLRKESMNRMRQGGDVIRAEVMHIDILNNLENMGNHILNTLQVLRHND